MFVGTHYRIGTFVYKSVLTKFQKSSFIDQYFFKIGNVLPDLHHELSQVNHYPEFTLDYIKEHTRIIQDHSIPTYKRSLSLGIICHFLSDYFCTYHALEPYKSRSTLQHLVYELKLHFRISYCLLFPKQLQKKLAICEAIRYPDIQTIIRTLQRDYFQENINIMNDILFALRATSITVAHLQELPVNTIENESLMLWWSQTGTERRYQ